MVRTRSGNVLIDNSIGSVKVGDDLWIQIKCLNQSLKEKKLPYEASTWTFSPSGRICASLSNHWFINKEMTIFVVDLVNKVHFVIPISPKEMKNVMTSAFYFSSEDQLIITFGFEGEVIQLVYKLDYSKQTMELNEKIAYKFPNLAFRVYYQPTKFVRCDGIDYLVLVDPAIFTSEYHGYNVLMIPKDPVNKNKPTRTFQFHFTDMEENLKNKIIMRTNIGVGNFIFLPCIDSNVIRGTKLLFSFVYGGTLIGVHWEVDLTKLKEISNEDMKAEGAVEKLLEEQANAYNFIEYSEFSLTSDEYLVQSVENIGLVHYYTNANDYGSDTKLSLLRSSNNPNASQHSLWDMETPANLNPNATVYDDTEDFFNRRFAVHPHGALLQFAFGERKGKPLEMKILKNLKLDLKSLALNKALFHKKTPIANHRAYRLCFNKEKPFNYSKFVPRKSFKREHSQ